MGGELGLAACRMHVCTTVVFVGGATALAKRHLADERPACHRVGGVSPSCFVGMLNAAVIGTFSAGQQAWQWGRSRAEAKCLSGKGNSVGIGGLRNSGRAVGAGSAVVDRSASGCGAGGGGCCEVLRRIRRPELGR